MQMQSCKLSVAEWHFCLSAETAVQLLHYMNLSQTLADTLQINVFLMSRGDMLLYTWHGDITTANSKNNNS